MIIRGSHYRTGDRIEITCQGDRITRIEPARSGLVDREVGLIAPALFDVQINGCLGISFNSNHLTLDKIRTVVDTCRQHGIGQFLATLITNSERELAEGFATLAQARAQDAMVAQTIVGYHLEGPFISPLDGARGAHPLEHVRAPDWSEFQRLQEAACGQILLVTLAPELHGAYRFIEKLVANNHVVALGHTDATAAQIRSAVHAGARLSTHLGNGCPSVLPRHDNVIWEQLACEQLWASIIPDGEHLPPAILKSIVRAKSPTQCIITCDASSLAGLPAGRYPHWGQTLDILPSGRIVVAGTPYLAGSNNFTDHCVHHIVQTVGLDFATAIDMASTQPRQLLGLPPRCLEVGMPADFFVTTSLPS